MSKTPKHTILATSVLSALLTTGCYSTEAVCTAASESEPSAVIGTGTTTFEAFETGDYLTPEWGPQGGQHVYGAVQVTGINPGSGKMVSKRSRGLDGGFSGQKAKGHDPVNLEFTLTFPDNVIDPQNSQFLHFLEGDTTEAITYGHTVFIDLFTVFEAYGEQDEIDVNLSTTVTDACGTVVTDNRDFRLLLNDEADSE